MLLGNYWRWKPGSRVHWEDRLNKTAQKQGWSVGCSASAGGMVAETGCGRSCLLLPYQEVRVAEFHCGNHKSSKLYVQLRTGGKMGFLKGTTGKSEAMLK